jgi:hypothetical protein
MINNSEDRLRLLEEIRQKKSEIENYIKRLDRNIYDLENKYLENTQNIGNIIKGWDQFFTTKPKNLPQTLNTTTKKMKFSNNERIFSQSSFNNFYVKEESNPNISGIV